MNSNLVFPLPKKSKPNIGARIQQLLEQHNVGLSKVANATGLTSETIRQIINGTIRNPGIETISKIAEAFSLTLFDLLGSNDITSQINKLRIKIIDFIDIKKINTESIEKLMNQSIESIEVLFINENFNQSDFFALKVNSSLAEKLTNCGMPMLSSGDFLIFSKDNNYNSNSIVLAKCKGDCLVLGIIIETEEKDLWIKSIDIPQKQIVIKINKLDVMGIVYNVQFQK